MGMIIVQKYGGSSMADVAKIGLVADKVARAKRAGHDVVVVVSAMGKTTDELVALARKIASAEGAGLDRATASPPRRELDMLVSTGERVSMALLSIAIQARGLEAISFTGSQSGILTNDRHFDARIIEVRPHRIEDELARGKIVIVAGYQGMSYKREITTLGRGGSDTTAVALAAALGADRCEIYSDVDGVYSADPRVVDDPVHLPVLDLATLQEMAEAGAKVINAQAVEWARRAKITIHARKTSDFEAIARETVAAESPPLGRVRAVVGLENVVHVRSSAPPGGGPGNFRRFLELAATLEAPVVDIAGTLDDATCVLPLLNVPDWERCRARLVAELPSLRLKERCATVSVVGSELTSTHAVPKFLSTLEDAGASPISFVTGSLRLTAVIASEKLAVAQRALHAVFIREN